MADDVTVADDPDEQRYVVLTGSEVAGFVVYELTGDTITFVHTEVDDCFEGQGLGSRLAAGALDDARARGLRVVARCPFIAGYIDRHPAYADLLAS